MKLEINNRRISGKSPKYVKGKRQCFWLAQRESLRGNLHGSHTDNQGVGES